MDKQYILGVNIGFHDASAALVKSGKLVTLIEQERVSRKKHAVAETPAKAVKQCIEEAGISFDDIAQVAIGWDLRETAMGKSRRFAPERLGQMIFSELDIDKEAATEAARSVVWVDHHIAHAASTYYSLGEDFVNSGERAAILIVDGAGEHCSTSFAVGEGRKIEMLQQWPIDQSIGFYYSSASRWAGFGDWGAGKLMGLACFGRPYQDAALRTSDDGYEIVAGGRKLNMNNQQGNHHDMMLSLFPYFESQIKPEFEKIFPYVPQNHEGAIAYADFAATIQDSLEQAILKLSQKLKEQTGCKTVALAGGVTMNCSMVGRLVHSGIFERVYIPPVPTDTGVALGAALHCAALQDEFSPQAIIHPYWSASLNEHAKSFDSLLKDKGLFAEQVSPEQIPRLVAQTIAQQKIVGWANGRGEIGERALGARSIIADPRSRSTLERLNFLKGREMWRPIAPSILKENYSDILMGQGHDPMRFMLAADVVRPHIRNTAKAITHVDGTARPQIVDRTCSPAYWSMINEFKQLTGMPMVTNTSFNLADEPIVSTATDAAKTFARGEGFDIMVAGDIIVAKTEQALRSCLHGEEVEQC